MSHHSHIPRFVYRFEDLADGVEAIVAHFLNVSNLAVEFNVTRHQLARGFELKRLQPRNTTGRASMEYFVSSYRKYSRQQLQSVLARPGLTNLLRHFGYDLLYHAWLGAQTKLDVAQRRGLDAGSLAAERAVIEDELHNELLRVFNHTRTRLYSFYRPTTRSFDIQLT